MKITTIRSFSVCMFGKVEGFPIICLSPRVSLYHQRTFPPLHHSFTMAENHIPPAADNASASTSPVSSTNKKSPNKKVKQPKRARGTMAIRLLLDHEHALTLAKVQLERAGEEIYEIPDLVEMALDRFMDYLQIKKGVNFLGTVPKKEAPVK